MTAILPPFREDDEISVHADRDFATAVKFSRTQEMLASAREAMRRKQAFRAGAQRKPKPVTLAKVEIGANG